MNSAPDTEFHIIGFLPFIWIWKCYSNVQAIKLFTDRFILISVREQSIFPQGTYESRISLLKLTRLLRLARLVGRVDRYSQVIQSRMLVVVVVVVVVVLMLVVGVC